MHESTLIRFRSEIRHFYLITVANIVFAALLMAFGISGLVGQAVLIYETFSTVAYVIYSPVVLIIALFAALAGFGWILTSVRVFEGIEAIKDELGAAAQDSRFSWRIVHGRGDSWPGFGWCFGRCDLVSRQEKQLPAHA